MVKTNILEERGVIRMVRQFGNRLELIVVRISINVGISKYQILFILDSRIPPTLQQLTIPYSIPAVHLRVNSIYP